MDQSISNIIYKQLKGEGISDAERAMLDQWLSMGEQNKTLYNELSTNEGLIKKLIKRNEAEQKNETALAAFAEKYYTTTQIRRINTSWIKYAAAIIIMIGAATWWYINNQKEKPSVTQTNPVPVQNDVAPGGNKATLTLSNGRKIILDSIANGQIATDGKASIVKKENGEVAYAIKSDFEGSGVGSAIAVSYNSLVTPRGGQYQLTLPDGSQVWLNAESSITYPTSFAATERERRVSITGEAYFEVAKDKAKPFIVLINKEKNIPFQREGSGVGSNDLEIQVLGTHFNVNAYTDEQSINTTLLEGSIRLTNVHTSLTLKPSQQGQLKENKLTLAANPDIEQVMAWKNGFFHFASTDLKTIMRQVQRWYDVEVIYESAPENVTFSGEIQRNLPLSSLLEGLQKTDIHFRIQGKKLIITP